MIVGQPQRYKRKDFRTGVTCARPGCTRRARHQWAAPCAINATRFDGDVTVWVPLCDECDVFVNRALLVAFGYPVDVVDELIAAYVPIQGDGAWDR